MLASASLGAGKIHLVYLTDYMNLQEELHLILPVKILLTTCSNFERSFDASLQFWNGERGHSHRERRKPFDLATELVILPRIHHLSRPTKWGMPLSRDYLKVRLILFFHLFKIMKADQIRQSFLDFFESKHHQLVPSAFFSPNFQSLFTTQE